MELLNSRSASGAGAKQNLNALQYLEMHPIWLHLAATAALLLMFGAWLHSLSIDVGLHFAVTKALMKYGTSSVGYLGIMGSYPTVAYWLATIVGAPTGSGLLGMWFVAIIAVYASYVAILSSILRSGDTLACIAFVVISLLAINTRAALGWEIIGNFAYPQLVSNAFYFGLIYYLSTQSKIATIANVGVVLAVAILALSTHGLAAMEALSTFGIVLVVQIAISYANTRKIDLASIFVLCIFLALGLGALKLHPAFAAMRAISNHNGVISLELSGKTLVTIGFLSSALLGWRVWKDQAKQPLRLIIFSAVVSASALMLLQFLFWYFLNTGSLYAVKKHCYIVFTLSLMAISLSLSEIAREFTARANIKLSAPRISAAVLAFMISFFIFHRPGLDILEFNNQVAYAEAATRISHPNFRSGNTAVVASDINGVIKFMISAAIFEMPIGEQAIYKLITGDFDLKSVAYVMTNSSSEIDKSCPERYAESSKYVIVPITCVPFTR